MYVTSSQYRTIKIVGARTLFHRDAFGEVSGFVDVAASGDGGVVGEELEGDDGEEGLEGFDGFGDGEDVVGDSLDVFDAVTLQFLNQNMKRFRSCLNEGGEIFKITPVSTADGGFILGFQ